MTGTFHSNGRLSARSASDRDGVAWRIRFVVLSLTVFAALVRLVPRMPGAELDSSWMLALNQAVSQALRFGDQVAFTFGPYASAYTAMYHPATDSRSLLASLLFAAAYSCAMVVVFRKAGWLRTLAYCGAMTGLVFSQEIPGADPVRFIARDAFFLSYYLLIIEVCVITRVAGGVVSNEAGRAEKLVIVFLFGVMGLLPLIKGSFFVLSLIVGTMSVGYLLTDRRRPLGLWCAASMATALVIFWLAARQSLAGLPGYLASIGAVVGGYTEAMQVTGSIEDIGAYLAVALVIVVAICLAGAWRPIDKAFVASGFAFVLFIAFKSSFVRHDIHVLIAATLLPLAALGLQAVVATRIALFAVMGSLAFALYVDRLYLQASPRDFLANLSTPYTDFTKGMHLRLSGGERLAQDYAAAIRTLAVEAPLPVLIGTTDVYSYGQSSLIASGNAWAPRPTLQSYAAFVPRLALANKAHLQGVDAPANVILKVEPIDNRFPLMEDGPSWPVFLKHYRPVSSNPSGLLLSRNDVADPPDENVKLLDAIHRLDEFVGVPSSARPVFVRLQIRPTLWGRALALAFKPPILSIEAQLANGRRARFRIVSTMAEAGFILSPLIRSEKEFALLYEEVSQLEGLRVVGFTVRSEGPAGLWAVDYGVTLESVPVTYR